jgi:hypothetical protein
VVPDLLLFASVGLFNFIAESLCMNSNSYHAARSSLPERTFSSSREFSPEVTGLTKTHINSTPADNFMCGEVCCLFVAPFSSTTNHFQSRTRSNFGKMVSFAVCSVAALAFAPLLAMAQNVRLQMLLSAANQLEVFN